MRNHCYVCEQISTLKISMTNLHCKSRKEAHKIHKVKVAKVMQLGSWHWALFVVLSERRRISGRRFSQPEK